MIPGVGRSNPITILGLHQIQCIKSDLKIWLKFLQGFNGVSFFHTLRMAGFKHIKLFLQIMQALMISGLAFIFKEIGFFSHGLLGGKIRKF